MSVIDILTRVDAICKKYDKYDIERQKDLNVSGDDAFARLYASIEADVEAALEVCFLPHFSLTHFLNVFLIRSCLVAEKTRNWKM